jgi:uncharacterized protein (DUF983 family)
MNDAQGLIPADLRGAYGLACPRCGQAERLDVQIVCMAELTIDGIDPIGDHDWNDSCCCRCPACGHGGTIAAFTTPPGPSG